MRRKETTIVPMAAADSPDRFRAGVRRLAGVQAVLLGCFATLLGFGFPYLPGLVLGGAALVALGAIAILISARRRRERAPGSRSDSDAVPMRRAVRVGLVVLGAAMAVYGAASLTGGWLGTPPWWEIENSFAAPRIDLVINDTLWDENALWGGGDQDVTVVAPLPDARPGREWISGGVVAAGLALVAVGAWPRRRKAAAS